MNTVDFLHDDNGLTIDDIIEARVQFDDVDVEMWIAALPTKESPHEVEALVNFYQARTTKALAALETGF